MTPPPAAAFAPPLQRPRARPQHAPSRRPSSRPPRRVSGPARSPARDRVQSGVPAAGGVALRAVGVYESVSTSAFLDRLVRGRLWIGMLACALVGVVALQLVVLNLNTGIGRKLARAALLQRENAQLGIEDAGALGEARIEPLAAAAGMTFAPSGSAHFVTASPSDVGRAAASLSTPVQAQTRSAASLASSGAEASAAGGEAQTAAGETQAGAGASSTGKAPGASGEASNGASTSAAAGGSGGESPGGTSSGAQGGASATSASGETAGGTGASAFSESSAASSSSATGGGVAAGHG